jgi:hypothetical protein
MTPIPGRSAWNTLFYRWYPDRITNFVRRDDWKILMPTTNVTPAPGADDDHPEQSIAS